MYVYMYNNIQPCYVKFFGSISPYIEIYSSLYRLPWNFNNRFEEISVHSLTISLEAILRIYILCAWAPSGAFSY